MFQNLQRINDEKARFKQIQTEYEMCIKGERPKQEYNSYSDEENF